MERFQPALTTIRPSSPHDFPWNRLDQVPTTYYLLFTAHYLLTTTEYSSLTTYHLPCNRLDQIVCGWDWQLGTGLRLRCKRFALLDYEAKQEDGLRRHVT